ncbi:MAG TPA: hypothetical protein VM940_15185 [Chthoniobacterales bacterium]|jgi:hypothetical protein|nr:hypothetical protein [Chthoniobacterales bacterium]
MEPTSTKKSRWLWILPAALAVLILNVLIHILYMVVYSYLINPGHDMAYYEAHAKFSAPYSSIVFGMPLMFFVCRWVARKFAPESSMTAALLVWVVYFLIDITALLSAGELGKLALLFAISFATKFAAAYFGGLAARKQLVKPA